MHDPHPTADYQMTNYDFSEDEMFGDNRRASTKITTASQFATVSLVPASLRDVHSDRSKNGQGRRLQSYIGDHSWTDRMHISV